MRRLVPLLFTLSTVVPVLFGCSSQSSKTVETTESITYTEPSPGETSSPTRETTTTITTTETSESDDGGCGGVLSCTIEVIGEVLALPFRAVGALIRAIF